MNNKSILGAIILSIQTLTIFAQQQEVTPPLVITNNLSRPATINCSAPGSANCNLINNNTFTPLPSYDPYDNFIYGQPFNLGLIPDWASTHGNPLIWDGINWIGPTFYPITPPFTNAGFCWLGVYANYPGFPPPTGGRGIAQKIPTLSMNHTYGFSFFRMANTLFKCLPGFCTETALDNFDIYLIRCADNTFSDNVYYNNPPLPVINKKIYCEQSVSLSNSWDQIFVTFTVDRPDYDVIWIYPKENDNGPLYKASALMFSYPELVDLNNFSAGPQPNPTPGNCQVDIGPIDPNCDVKNAVFSWQAPNFGTIYPAAPDQRLYGIVDASNILHQGDWTLRMTVPTAINPATNNCSQLATVSATVNVPPCTNQGVWPKVYYTWYPQLSKDNNGNIFAALSATGDLGQNINHSGVLPPPPNNDTYYTFPFGNSGVTNWTKPDLFPLYILNSGAIQLGHYDFYGYPIPDSYCDGSNGSPIPTPKGLLASDRILAETSAGLFITLNGNSIYLKSSTAILSSEIINPTYGTSQIQTFKFNPFTNRLYFLNEENSYKVYDIINNNFTPYSSSPIYASPLIIQVDNQDRAFAYTVNGLEQYNYLNNTYSPVTVSGFPGASMFPMWSLNPYTENRFMSINSILDKIYAVDLSLMTAKNASITGGYHPESFTYAFVGNDVYISTCLSSTVILSSQSIPALPNLDQQSGFITKLNLNTDFSSFQGLANKNQKTLGNAASFKVTISPNPLLNNNLNLIITVDGKQSLSVYDVIITNSMGRVVLQKNKFLSTTSMNIGNLEKGIYYVEIINSQGERVTKSFMKL